MTRAEAGSPGGTAAYRASIDAWHRDRIARLTSETGWLTVAGFFWLDPGENPFGTAPDNAIVLPPGSAPAHAGSFRLETSEAGQTARVILEPGTAASLNGEPVTPRALVPDDPGPADKLTLGRLTLWVLVRNGALAVRLRDPEAALRRDFAGIESFDPDEAFRVRGRYVPFARARDLGVPNRLGHTDTSRVYGTVAFTLAGHALSLVPLTDGAADSALFFVFADETTGRETYGGGRFLEATLEADGSVQMDFNKAYNPPCAFNPWTTCPLPPEGNTLPVAVRAGEKTYAHPPE